jgi:S1-C subfamily serine protease
MRSTIVLFTYLYFLFSFCNSAKALETQKLFQNAKDSVVLIMSFDKNNQPLAIGSGFFIRNRENEKSSLELLDELPPKEVGALSSNEREKNEKSSADLLKELAEMTRPPPDVIIATNYHVLAGATSVVVKTSDGKVFKVHAILGIDTEHDLALLESTVQGKHLLLSKRTPDIGEDIIAIGNPKGLEGTLSTGIVSGVRNENGSIYYQVTAPISPGSSGGPVINENGEVIGVSTFYVQGGQNLNFAMPSAYIFKLLQSPKRVSLAKASRLKTSKKVQVVEANVKVVDYIIDGSYSLLQCSIFNGASYPIRNIRLVAIFYSRKSGQYPVHFKLINVDEKIPPGLSQRVSHKDNELYKHGTHGLWGRGGWTAKFRILDYDILQQAGGNGLIPTFE